MSDFRRRLIAAATLGGGSPSYPLPVGAIPCEMVFSDGYSTFINTDIVPTVACSVETYVCFVKEASSFSCPIGSYYSHSSSTYRWNPVGVSSTGPYNIGLGNVDEVSSYPTNARVARRWMRVSANASGGVIESYDGEGTLVNTETLTFTVTSNIPSFSIGLLGRKNSSTGIASGIFRGGLGRTKIYGDDHFGTLLADYDPCYYQGNFGFWDHIKGQHLIGNTPANIFGIGSYWNTEGFWPNSNNTNSTTNARVGYLVDNRGLVTTKMLTIPQGCTTIRFNAGTVHSGTNYDLITLDESEVFTHWWGYTTADREISGFSDSTYVRMAMPVEAVDSCYIYDVTNGAYIWKGLNV